MLKNQNLISEVFNKLVIDQFGYGGQKYASTNKKEATDILFEKHSHRWLVGTIDKYTFRFTNLARERDLLKIATYMYILWLKRGFHIDRFKGTKAIINTTVPVKSANFSKFTLAASENKNLKKKNSLQYISKVMGQWSKKKFNQISYKDIFDVYYACYILWDEKFSHIAGQDKDTWNDKTIVGVAEARK